MGTRFICSHQSAEADHISMQNSSELPFPRAGLEGRSHRLLDAEANHRREIHGETI